MSSSSSSKTLVQALLGLLCGLVLASCAEPAPSDAEDAADDAGVTEQVPAEPEPKVWSPYTVEEARALRDSFRWEDTVALPEEPLSQRTPGGMEKAALDPVSQIISSLVSLHYVQIYVNNADQLRELDEMFIHWDMAPLFEEEIPAGEFAMTFDGDPADKGGMFVYAFMPAVTYNLIRAAALLGEDTYKAMPMRTVPLEARAWDGSVKWEYLAGVLMSYAPERTHLTDAGETPFPSVLDAEEGSASASASADGAQQKRWGRRLRKWARKTRDAVRTVVDTVRKGVGELQKLVNKDITLTINMPAKVWGPFTKNQRAWDQFGQLVPSFGKELTLHNTRVNVTQLGGISLFQTKTDNGVVTVNVPKSRWTHVCIEADSPAARMESGLLWPMRQCFARFRPGSSGSRTFTVTMQEFYSFMLMQDSRVFASEVLGYSPPKATVQVGWPADGIGLINDARPFVPCLEATNGPVTVFNSIVDAISLLAPGAANSVEFLLTSDIVMPSDTNRLRVQPVHEYGHYFFCTLINSKRSQTFNVVWSQFMRAALSNAHNDVNYMMEGFAEWFASQVAGGVDYFPMVSGTELADSDYLFIPGQTAKGFGLEENVGSALCGTAGALPFPKCQTTKILRDQFEDRKEEGMATFATLLHDIIDRRAPRQCAGAGCVNERTSSGAVWKRNSSRKFELFKAPAGTWGGEKNDESVELPVRSMVSGIGDFANKNWAFGAALTQENLMVPIIEQMYWHGYSKEQVCELFKLHSRNNTCPGWVPENDGYIIQ